MISALVQELKIFWLETVVSRKQLRGLLGVFTFIPAVILIYRYYTYHLVQDEISIFLLVFIGINNLIFFFQSVYRFIYKIWMSFAILLGFFISNIFLTVFFYVILTPVGFGMRVFGHDPLEKKYRTNEKSYWQSSVAKNYKKQF